MSKRAVMICLCLLSMAAGFAAADNILGTHLRTVSVREGDAFYTEPSLTSASCTAQFRVGEELLAVDRLELKQPTAAVMLRDMLLEDGEQNKYKLAAGAVYKIADARLQQPASPCVLEVRTAAGEKLRLEVPKDALRPVDEGTWLRLRQKDGAAEGWRLAQTSWY